MKKVGKGCLIAIGVIVVLGIIGAAINGGKSTSSTTPAPTSSTQAGTTVTPAPKAEAMKVTALTLIGDFDNNKLSAADKWKGKLIQTSAKVKNISEDIMGNPYLSLEPPTSDQYYFGTTMQCFFKDKEALKSLSNGTSYTLQGTVDGMSIGIITINDCSIVQ